jgi:hypothetical protein
MAPLDTRIISRSVQNYFPLKITLCVLISLLGLKTVLNVSRSSTITVDQQQIDAVAAAAYQNNLTALNLELVEGSLHESSNPTRVCHSTTLSARYFTGSTTFLLKDGTEVTLTIADCHPCTWPVEFDKDISAFANLIVRTDDNMSFSIESFIGGPDDDLSSTSGRYSILLSEDLRQRIRIRQIINQIGGRADSVLPRREEYNRALRRLLSPGPVSEAHVLIFTSLLCKSVARSRIKI